MTTEEKAKRYDEAINIAKNIHRFSSDPAEIKRMEQIFPELAESEDESIRKEIISALKFANVKGVYNKHIAWIERQAEQNPTDMSIKEKAHQIAWETSKHYDPLLSKECWCEMAALDMASWLEKQGKEQKIDAEL